MSEYEQDQSMLWASPDLMTGVTPDSLRKSMPDSLAGQRQAMIHFYNKFKLNAKQLAPTGNCSYELEISTTESGIRSDIDVMQLHDDLKEKLLSEGFRFIGSSYDDSTETAFLHMAWKEEPRQNKQKQLQIQQDLALQPPPGAYQLNALNAAELTRFYQMFGGGFPPYPQ